MHSKQKENEERHVRKTGELISEYEARVVGERVNKQSFGDTGGEVGCIGLRGKILVLAGYYWSSFCEKLLEASACAIETMPESSKTDPSLAKAEHITNGGSTSGIT